jgi:hypothetical protein
MWQEAFSPGSIGSRATALYRSFTLLAMLPIDKKMQLEDRGLEHHMPVGNVVQLEMMKIVTLNANLLSFVSGTNNVKPAVFTQAFCWPLYRCGDLPRMMSLDSFFNGNMIGAKDHGKIPYGRVVYLNSLMYKVKNTIQISRYSQRQFILLLYMLKAQSQTEVHLTPPRCITPLRTLVVNPVSE